jgi:hypothetical protein
MTFEHAAHFATYQQERDRLNQEPDILTAIRKATNLDAQARRPEDKLKSSGGLGKLVHALIGGVVGYTAARVATSALDLSPEFSNKLQTSAATAGAIMGFAKSASARTQEEALKAFRLGFLKAAMDRGYFKTAGFGLYLDPASVLSLPRAAAEGATRVSSAIGSGIGAASAPDEVEEDLMKMQLEKDLLQQRLKSALVNRQNKRIRDVLAKTRA